MRVPREIIERLKDYSAWEDGGPTHRKLRFSLLSYVECVATADLVLGFAELFCPELVYHEGYYFLANRFDEASYVQWKERGLSSIEIQRVVNHLHLATLLQGEDVEDDVARVVATSIAYIWSRVFLELNLTGEVAGDTYSDLAVTLVGHK